MIAYTLEDKIHILNTLTEVRSSNNLSKGICYALIKMYPHSKITYFYVQQHKPINLRTIFLDGFFWKEGDVRSRIKWLNKHIEKLTKQIEKENNDKVD